jgi:tRNA threonylcarbamoyladenosine biosynthesis protein TsaB
VIVLAIETATLEVGAAVIGGDGPIAVERTRPGRRHAESLHPAIVSVLDAAGIGVGELEAVAVDIGPGLFTGLRVGIAAAKALSFARRLPLAAPRSTEVLRHDAETQGVPAGTTVVPVVDMRRGEIAWELPGEPPRSGAPDELLETLRGIDGELKLVGDGALRWRAVFQAADPQRTSFGDESLAAPSVLGVGDLALERLRLGATNDALGVEALYLRAADARPNYVTRQTSAPGIR